MIYERYTFSVKIYKNKYNRVNYEYDWVTLSTIVYHKSKMSTSFTSCQWLEVIYRTPAGPLVIFSIFGFSQSDRGFEFQNWCYD